MRRWLVFILILLVSWKTLSLQSCIDQDKADNTPEIGPIKEGFKVSAAIGYCASLTVMAFQGYDLTDNVTFLESTGNEFGSSGLISVRVDEDHPLPYNDHIGDILIGAIWDNEEESGVMSVVFGNLDVSEGDYQFYGLHTVPISRKSGEEEFFTVFAQQDIVVGRGSDTLTTIGLSRIEFDRELERLNEDQPDDVFAAVQQNVWYLQFRQKDRSDVYDDTFEINGGGQIVGASNESGGILYHALIETRYDYSSCNLNPVAGVAFIQNLKAGEGIDLGNILLNFHQECDGQADITISTGSFGRAINNTVYLNFD